MVPSPIPPQRDTIKTVFAREPVSFQHQPDRKLAAIPAGQAWPPLPTSPRRTKGEEFLSNLSHYEIAFPIQVDQNGDFLSFDVKSHRKWRSRRSAGHPSYDTPEQHVFYKVSAHRTQFLLNLTLHTNLLARRFRVEYWKKGGVDYQHEFHEDCHYAGHLQDEYLNSKVAISNCNGLN
ncbi:hypothetical protein L345_05970, partial [Ophiophagus hannah]